MFKEILQIIPKIAAADLAAMEKALGSRFGRLAKKFGKGLIDALKGGGIAGVALGLIDKILNPLKETQEAIDRVLQQGNDLVTNAKQFGTTAGKLFRLQQLAKSTGLEPESVNILLEKFQSAVADAIKDPTKQTSVRAFVGDKDTAEAFFQFIQGLQKLPKVQQTMVQQEVFGEKQILRMAQFLQTDFGKQSKLVGGPTAEALTPKLEKLGDLNDLRERLEATRNLNDTFKKGSLITDEMVKAQAKREQLDLDQQNKQIQAYEALSAISTAATQLTDLAKQAVLGITNMLVKLTDLNNQMQKLTNSRVVKGIMKFTGMGGN